MSHLSIKHVQTNAKQNRTRCVCTGRDLTTGVEDGKGGLRCVFGLLLLCLFSISTQVLAEKALQFDIPGQQADEALLQFGVQADISVVYQHEVVKHYQTNRLRGVYTPAQAVRILLQDSGLQAKFKSRAHLVVTQIDRERDSMKTKKKLLALLVGVFATGGGDALAQGQGQSEEEWLLEEIVVTAQKREQRLIDVPMSVAALSGEQMANAGVTDLQSLSFSVPGLSVTDAGSFVNRVTIRGIGNIVGNSSLVGLYIDEASVATLPVNQIDLRAYDVKRVEVLKGPQGSLYGEGSVGGTIRYITEDPQLDGFTGDLSLGGASIQDGDTSSEIKSIINVPLSNNLGLRVASQYIESGGWIDQPALGRKDINDSELLNVRAKLLWQPTEALDIRATAIVHRNDVGAQNTNEDDDGNYRQFFDDPSTPSASSDYDFYNVTLAYDFGSVTLTSSTGYLEADNEARKMGAECCFSVPSGEGFWQFFVDINTKSSEIFTQEIRLNSNGESNLHWTTGLYYKRADAVPFSASGGMFGVPGGTPGVTLFPGGTFVEDSSSRSWAVFGEAGYSVTEALELGLGFRYFEDDQEYLDNPASTLQQETFDSFNPKIYFSYAVSDDIRLYANVAKGFRSGGFNGAGNPSYDPESRTAYEVGTKMTLLESRLQAELAYFRNNYDDYLTFGAVPGSGNLNIVISNGGEAEVKGIEMLVRYAVSEQLELGASGDYTDTEFTEVNVTQAAYQVGDPLDFVPQYSASLWIDYSFSWFDSASGFIRLDYKEQGKSHYRNRSFGSDYRDTSDVVEILNGRLGWERDNLSVELYGLNLLNDRDFTAPAAIEKSAPRSQPRTIGLNFGFSF